MVFYFKLRATFVTQGKAEEFIDPISLIGTFSCPVALKQFWESHFVEIRISSEVEAADCEAAAEIPYRGVKF